MNKFVIFLLFHLFDDAFSGNQIGKFNGECGQNFNNQINRIVGGSEAVPNGWPSMVRIVFKYFFRYNGNVRFYSTFCGGTLIDNDTIITAAHCFVNYFYLDHLVIRVVPNEFHPTYASMYKVYAGVHDLKEKSDPLEVFSYTQVKQF